MGGAISGPSSMHANNRPPTWRTSLGGFAYRYYMILYIQFGFKERNTIIPYITMISHACKGSEDRILSFCCHKTMSQSSRGGEGYLSRYQSKGPSVAPPPFHSNLLRWPARLLWRMTQFLAILFPPRTNGRKVHLEQTLLGLKRGKMREDREPLNLH